MHSDKALFLNLGCGQTYSPSPEWVNLDVEVPAQGKDGLAQYQLCLGIPFADDVFDGVYHSHLLEHFPRGQAAPFLRECLRVLRPGGVLRVAVPDVEGVLRHYLAALDEASTGEVGAEDRLLWMQVELLDQLTRRKSGGTMLPAWQTANAETFSFMRSRIGHELDAVARAPQPGPLRLPEEPLWFPALNADFLQRGELHQWMYDRISLGALLREAGFADVRVVAHDQSVLPVRELDCAADGSARKPDSLFMECRKPAREGQPPLPIAVFSTTDTGGAAIAALRLHDGLRAAGAGAVTYVHHKRDCGGQMSVLPPPPGDRVVPDGHGGALLASFSPSMKRLVGALNDYPGRPAESEAFSISEAPVRLPGVPLLDAFDIFHLHWVAGFMDVPGNADFWKGKKIVWTLHDMNPFTGGCHYPDGCDRFKARCGACPQLGSADESDISRLTWKRKDYAFRNLDITVVSPSRWLADEARASSLLGRFPVHHIPNGLPLDVFKPYPKPLVKEQLGIPPECRTILFSAENVLNRRKGFAYLKTALELLKNDPQGGLLADRVMLLLLGHGGEHVKDLPFPVKALGRFTNPASMAAVYSAADVLAVPTLEDNLPNVLLEAMACGTPSAAFAVGGVPEILDHEETGYLAAPRDPASLAKGLLWALTSGNAAARSRLCRARAEERYSLEMQAERYLDLYRSLLG